MSNSVPKDIIYGNEARYKMLQGITKLANAVKETMGPRGRNVVMERAFAEPYITKDGVTVAKEIDFADPYENMGAQMVKYAASRSGDSAGDGTTTTTVLTESIARKGYQLLAAEGSPVEIKRGIDIATEIMVSELKSMAIGVTKPEEIAQVGTISANGDMEIGNLIAEAMDNIGNDGVISVRESSDSTTHLTIESGMPVEKGNISRYLMPEGSPTVEYEGAAIMVINQVITHIQEILPALNSFMEFNKRTGKQRSLVIFCIDIEKNALAQIVNNYQKGVISIAIVKAPGHGEYRESVLEDIAIYTGATVFGRQNGYTPLSDWSKDKADVASHNELNVFKLGFAERATLSLYSTNLFGGGLPEIREKVEENIEKRLGMISQSIKISTSTYDTEKYQKRAGALSGGIAVIHVGGNSDIEVKEKKDRVDDALHATRAAALYGIVPGGGTALIQAAKSAAKKIAKYQFQNEDQLKGARIVLAAAEDPCRQICVNAGVSADVVIDNIIKRGKGFNAATNKYGDLVKDGVIDPVMVTITALQSGAATAGMFLTTSCAITKVRTENPFHDPSIKTLGAF